IKKPQRISNTHDQRKKCSLLGLSMLTTEDKAIARYQELKKQFKNVNKLIGTHLAKGKIQADDGLATKHDKKGHFDFFEYVDTDLTKRFVISKDLGAI
ncbi:hypothetical protein ACMUMS_17325, partial [Acinetobacter courvalinii]|uniref:hypothetical protein n=1 Tax=Acinetobacter courvalinii TaxID=280147 RepID=UPI003A886D36